MNQLIGDRATVLATLQTTITAFENDGPVIQQVMNASLQPDTEAECQAARLNVVQQLQDAYAAALADNDQHAYYMPRIPIAALFQRLWRITWGKTWKSTRAAAW